METITLTQTQKQILCNHAESENPNEACAIIFGTKKDEDFSVEKIFLTENTEKSPVNFTISAEQILEADRMERNLSLKIIGIFHSHPNSQAYPSETDKKYMDLNPVIWIIYSGTSKEFKAFRLESTIKEVRLEII